MRFLLAVLRLAAALLVLVTAVPSILAIFGSVLPVLDILNHLQLLLFFGTLVAFAMALLVRVRRWAVLLAFLGFAASAWTFVPEWLSSLTPRPSVTGATTFKVMTHNVFGLNYDMERVASVIASEDPDIVALQEVPLGGAATRDALADFSAASGMRAVAGPTLDTPRRRYGNAVLSRLPVKAARTLDLSFHQREPRGALDADIECGATLLRVVATHLGLSATERSMQVRSLLAAFDSSELPVILLGDINEWFVRGRALRALVTHFRRAPAPRTFPTICPLFALDRIWVHPGEWLTGVRVHRTATARKASDHYPLVAELNIPAMHCDGNDVSGRHA